MHKLLTLVAIAAHSPGMPHYDIGAECSRSDLGMALCVQMEKADRSAAEAFCPDVDPKVRKGCVAKVGSEMQYGSLVECIIGGVGEAWPKREMP